MRTTTITIGGIPAPQANAVYCIAYALMHRWARDIAYGNVPTEHGSLAALCAAVAESIASDDGNIGGGIDGPAAPDVRGTISHVSAHGSVRTETWPDGRTRVRCYTRGPAARQDGWRGGHPDPTFPATVFVGGFTIAPDRTIVSIRCDSLDGLEVTSLVAWAASMVRSDDCVADAEEVIAARLPPAARAARSAYVMFAGRFVAEQQAAYAAGQSH